MLSVAYQLPLSVGMPPPSKPFLPGAFSNASDFGFMCA